MPTREQLIGALRQADANGDTIAAQRFAEMIKSGTLDQQSESDLAGSHPHAARLGESGQAPPSEPNEDVFAGLPDDVIRDIKSRFSSDEQTIMGMRSQALTGDGANTPKAPSDYKIKRAADFERLRLKNPALASEIENMSGYDAFMIGAGEGFTNLGRGVGLIEQASEIEKAAMKALHDQKGAATVGKFTAQAAPFLVPGGAAANIGSAALRTAAMGGIGAAEGGIIAKGEGGSTEDVLVGAGAGLLLGAGGEVLAPIVSRYGRQLVKRLTGKNVDKVIQENGLPTPDFQEALDKSGENFDELVQEFASTESVTSKLAKAANDKDAVELAIDSAQPSAERVKAAQALGLNPEDIPTPVLSKSQTVHEVGGGLAAIPGNVGGAQLDEFANQLGMKADDLIVEMGGSLDQPQASADLLSRITAKRDAMYKAESAAYDDLQKAINPSTRVNTKALLSKIEKDAEALGGVPKLDGPARRIYRMLSDKNKPTYGLIDRERKRIGAALSKKEGVYANADSAELSKLYSQLTELQEGVASAFPEAKELWQSAKQQTIARKALEEQSQTLFGRTLEDPVVPKLVDGLRGITGKNGKKFSQIVNSIPKKDRPAMMATALNGVFSRASSANEKFNASMFSKWMRDLKRSPSAYKQVKDNLPEGGMARLEALNELADGLADVSKNRVRTGVVKAMLDDLDKSNGFAAKLYNMADNSPVGVSNTVRIASNVAKMAAKERTPSVKAVDDLLLSPSFKKAFIEAANDPDGAAARQAERVLKGSKAYKEFLKTRDPKVEAEILSLGLIPWLLADNGEDNES